MPEGSIQLRRTVQGSRSRVFEAWCRAELLEQWFIPEAGWRAQVEADPRVGGRYRIAVTDPEGAVHVQQGAYLAIEPPSRLVFSWTCHELGVSDSRVTVEFEAAGDRTEVVVTHELPPDPEVRRGHENGWQGCLEHLDAFLAGPGKVHQG